MASEITSCFTKVDDLRAYLSRPKDGGSGGMLLLPMITGIGAQVREFADDIARAGVTALSWDPWHGVSGDDTPRERLAEMLRELDDEACLSEMSRLLDHMPGELGVTRVGVIGWCMGGRFAFLLAGRDQRVCNVVAYHPTVADPTRPKPHPRRRRVRRTNRRARDDALPRTGLARAMGELHPAADGTPDPLGRSQHRARLSRRRARLLRT